MISETFHKPCHLDFQDGEIKETMMPGPGLGCWTNYSLVADPSVTTTH